MRLAPPIGRILFWLSWPLSYIVLRTSWRTRALIICGDEVLVVKMIVGSGLWGLTGGGLHRGEIITDGLRREVYEEVGIKLLPDDYQPLGKYCFRAKGLPFQCHLFAVELAHKPIMRLQRNEISQAAWLRPDQLSIKNALPDVHESLRRLAAQG